jgi:HD-GYP domain-containing protein (c-di-GMP phosphodiesterase class II)
MSSREAGDDGSLSWEELRAVLGGPRHIGALEFDRGQFSESLIDSLAEQMRVAEIVLQHHERLDGSGYPHGLRGDEILPGARVLAVADVVEAMVTHRPFRPALPLEEALAEITAGVGSRYDAEVCAVAIRLFQEEGFSFGE